MQDAKTKNWYQHEQKLTTIFASRIDSVYADLNRLKDGTSLYMFSGQLKRTIASGETRTKTFAASVALDSQKKHEVHKLMVEEGDGVSVRYMSPDALENVKDVARTLKQLKKDAGSNHPEYREAVREVDARMGPEMRFLEHSIYRTWSTPDGKFTVKGKHLSHDSKSIVLGRKDNGKKISVPYSKLSEKCKRFIAQNFDDVSFDGVVAP